MKLAKLMLLFGIGLDLVFGAEGKILANFVMPHGGIALDPTHFNTTNATSLKEAWEVHQACVQVGKEIAQLNPDLVFLSTPHGIADLRNFVLYMNPTAQGYADTDNCACPPCCYNASVHMDVNITKRIVESFDGKNVSGLSGFGPPGQSSEPFPLRWGEVIPVHFIPDLNASNIKFVVLSQPSRRYTQDTQMIPELLALGSSLYSILESTPKKVVIIVSGDLAHTHLASGPYGYSNTSEPFDQACSSWASSLNRHYLLKTATSLVDRALSCGYTGFVTLQGLMEAAGIESWKSEVLVNHHPSYYGMMVAAFRRQKQ